MTSTVLVSPVAPFIEPRDRTTRRSQRIEDSHAGYLPRTVKSPLSIYMNDHLAGATVGVELARRLRSSNADDDSFGPPTARICAELEADRETLEATMEQLGVSRRRLKPVGAWLGEKLGRFKLNGQLTGYAPLSRLVELELLYIGLTGQIRLWEALESSLGRRRDGLDFAALAKRAAGQRGRVEELHLEAAALALPAQA